MCVTRPCVAGPFFRDSGEQFREGFGLFNPLLAVIEHIAQPIGLRGGAVGVALAAGRALHPITDSAKLFIRPMVELHRRTGFNELLVA